MGAAKQNRRLTYFQRELKASMQLISVFYETCVLQTVKSELTKNSEEQPTCLLETIKKKYKILLRTPTNHLITFNCLTVSSDQTVKTKILLQYYKATVHELFKHCCFAS